VSGTLFGQRVFAGGVKDQDKVILDYLIQILKPMTSVHVRDTEKRNREELEADLGVLQP
jgi:hypothetical protein